MSFADDTTIYEDHFLRYLSVSEFKKMLPISSQENLVMLISFMSLKMSIFIFMIN